MNESNRLYIEEYGHEVTLTTYAEGAADDYEDKALTSTDATVKALRKLSDSGTERNSSGASPLGDAVFWLKDTVTISDGSDTPASKIVDRGESFTVIVTDNQDNGVIVATCRRMR